MKEKHTLVLIYNSFKDPLFQNLMLKYIWKLTEKKHLKFHLITFEQAQYEMTSEEVSEKKLELADSNIYWIPLRFHTGRFILLKKVWDLVQLFKVTLQLTRRHNLEYIMAFANVSAALSGILTTFFHLKLVIYSYEPHAKFMVDMGHWKKSGIKFKALNFFELLAAKRAFHIMTGTHAMKKELEAYLPESKISVAPTAVDPQDFKFSQSDRNHIRGQLKAENKKILLYIGKLGGLYYEKEIVQIMCEIAGWDVNIFPLLITDFDHQTIINWIKAFGGKPEDFTLMKPIERKEVSAYLSAADIGIIGIPPLPFQKFRSPTKTAEFLLCGLPTLICDGISEDSAHIKKHNLGCVVKSFSTVDVTSKKENFLNLIEENRENFLSRSRPIALAYRSIEKVHEIFNKIYQ
ncbi:MAG: hypothetical protein ABJQ37_03015 [Reichenbachiella sp.]|uniref:hypothetical protein n=3 Tax=Reichenbachiella sp. TaxID=2184521 RepID=UPI00329A4889